MVQIESSCWIVHNNLYGKHVHSGICNLISSNIIETEILLLGYGRKYLPTTAAFQMCFGKDMS